MVGRRRTRAHRRTADRGTPRAQSHPSSRVRRTDLSGFSVWATRWRRLARYRRAGQPLGESPRLGRTAVMTCCRPVQVRRLDPSDSEGVTCASTLPRTVIPSVSVAGRARSRSSAPFPPTPCGLATFSAALADGLSAHGATVDVVRVADGASSEIDRVVGELRRRRRAPRTTARTCSTAVTWPSSSTNTASTAAPTATRCWVSSPP